MRKTRGGIPEIRRLNDRVGVEFHRGGPVAAAVEIKASVSGFVTKEPPTDIHRVAGSPGGDHAAAQVFQLSLCRERRKAEEPAQGAGPTSHEEADTPRELRTLFGVL